MTKSICCIFNLATHYNAPIYRLMDEQIKCDFYFGDHLGYPIKLMNYDELRGFKKELRNIKILGNFYWQKGALKLFFKQYEKYILTGEPHCISTWVILILSKFKRKETILWTHGWYGDESFLKRKIKKLFFAFPKDILVYGENAKNLMIQEGIRRVKLTTIFNSLDYAKQLEVRKTLTLLDMYERYFLNRWPTIVYVGRVQKNKNLELLMMAIDYLRGNNVFCNLIVIGKEVDNTNIRSLAVKYSVENQVWNYGPCYDEQKLGQFIFNADVCVVPGNIGLTVMHSYVYGTPVITHDNFSQHGPEFEAIKAGITGDFFEENSLPDLCCKIVKWISQPIENRRQIRRSCYEIIEKSYNPYVQIDILKKVLK